MIKQIYRDWDIKHIKVYDCDEKTDKLVGI